MQKNVLAVFFLKKVSFFLDTEQLFLAVWNKNKWHRSQKCEILVQRNNLVIFLNETFFQSRTSSGKRPDFERNFSNKSLDLSIFVFRRQFGFFPRDLGFFGLWAQTFELRQKNYQQCFQKCIQGVEENVPVIFCLLEFSTGTWAFFVEDWAKKIRQFSQHSKIRVQNKILVLVSEGEFFFQFCTLSWKISDSEQNLTKKVLNFPFFLLEGHSGTFFSGNIGFFSEFELKYSSFGRRVFNSLFKRTFKMWKRTFLFF